MCFRDSICHATWSFAQLGPIPSQWTCDPQNRTKEATFQTEHSVFSQWCSQHPELSMSQGPAFAAALNSSAAPASGMKLLFLHILLSIWSVVSLLLVRGCSVICSCSAAEVGPIWWGDCPWENSEYRRNAWTFICTPAEMTPKRLQSYHAVKKHDTAILVRLLRAART